MPTTLLEPLHRFHPYCARFPSALAESALLEYTTPGDSVFDPFCGSGTALVAALALGRRAVGGDIDALAGMLSAVKCQPQTSERYAAWREPFVANLTAAFAEIGRAWQEPRASPRPGVTWPVGSLRLALPTFPELNYWFPPQLTAALAAIAQTASACPEAHFQQVGLLALSAAVLAKWPNTLSYAKDVDHTRPHRRVRRFTLDGVRQTYLNRLDRCFHCLGELHRVYAGAGVLADRGEAARVVCPHDARQPTPGLEGESQALIVTSPPYFNAVDYPRAHRLALCWMNGYAPADLVSRRNYIGLRHAPELDFDAWLRERPRLRRLLPAPVRGHLARRLGGFYADLELALAQAWRALRPGGHAVYVIANNVLKGQRLASHTVLAYLAERLGFTILKTSSREIANLRRRYPVGPFGFDGPLTHEYLVVLRKPPPA